MIQSSAIHSECRGTSETVALFFASFFFSGLTYDSQYQFLFAYLCILPLLTPPLASPNFHSKLQPEAGGAKIILILFFRHSIDFFQDTHPKRRFEKLTADAAQQIMCQTINRHHLPFFQIDSSLLQFHNSKNS